MNIHEQFDALTKMEEDMAKHIVLSREDTLDFLHTMRPIEIFLKDIHQKGTTDIAWEYPMLTQESYRFRELPASLNIMFDVHYRYDCSRIHTHNYFQLNYVFAGSPVIHYGSEQYTASPGDFFLLAPEVPHWIESNADDILVIKLYIRLTTFENTFFRLLGEKNILTAFFRKALYDGSSRNNYICFHTHDDPYLPEYVLESFRLFTNRIEYRDIIMECRITELFCMLVSGYTETAHSPREAGSSAHVGKILTYIRRHYDSVTLEETAAWAGYTKTYLCRLLKRSTGKTFTELVHTIRMEKACHLLVSTSLPITEICTRTGYGTIKHFYRVFRECTGTTPQQYRQTGTARDG